MNQNISFWVYNRLKMTREIKREDRARSEVKKELQRIVNRATREVDLSRVPPEAFQAVATLVKDVFSEDAREGDEASWWVPQEGVMDLATACIKFKIAGVDHNQLSKMILEQNPRIKAARVLGSVSDSQFEFMHARLSDAIFPHYPANYRNAYERSKGKGKKAP